MSIAMDDTKLKDTKSSAVNVMSDLHRILQYAQEAEF